MPFSGFFPSFDKAQFLTLLSWLVWFLNPQFLSSDNHTFIIPLCQQLPVCSLYPWYTKFKFIHTVVPRPSNAILKHSNQSAPRCLCSKHCNQAIWFYFPKLITFLCIYKSLIKEENLQCLWHRHSGMRKGRYHSSVSQCTLSGAFCFHGPPHTLSHLTFMAVCGASKWYYSWPLFENKKKKKKNHEAQ